MPLYVPTFRLIRRPPFRSALSALRVTATAFMIAVLSAHLALAQTASSETSAAIKPAGFSPGAGVVLNAHNCYPEGDNYWDRIERALSTGLPVAIEQDIAWHKDPATGNAWSVLSHETQTTGTEPTIETYFFETVRPIIEKELANPDPSRWPVVYLHFNFKTAEREHVEFVHDILKKHTDWLSSAVRDEDESKVGSIDYKPILVMTETDPTEKAVFHDDVPVGLPFYVFGSAPGESYIPKGLPREEQLRLMVTTDPAKMLASPATNYRRWWNNAWLIVEEGGASRAGDWQTSDEQRLQSLVHHAHGLGYMIRFYTLNGHPREESHGWGSSYNFGSLEAAKIRWKASVTAGVDFVATDQYEEFGTVLRETRKKE